jgi:DNA (cytosine-5)-methyltransferase 1
LQTTNNRQFDQRITLAETEPLKMLEFFAGSGLVSTGLNGMFQPIWANDICSKKAEVYKANHPKKNFKLGDIKNVNGANLPLANLSWASFPCQDLSLAGLTGGIHANRSGLVWQWLRIIDEMPVKPRVLVAENVTGLVSYANGENYRFLHNALFERKYKVGAIVLDAVKFVPQSRPRVFVIAVSQGVTVPEELIDSAPNWLHPVSIIRVSTGLPGWIWWKAPLPPQRKINLNDIVEWEATSEPDNVVQRYLEIMNPRHKKRLISMKEPAVATGYKRTRNGKQVLELRFDGIAGCLRTPNGGSSRQILIIKREGKIGARLLTVRETARLMGAPDNFLIPGSYNDGYRAMGDAVAFPVVKFLGKHILLKLTKAAYHV